jgi:hypothetical protein
MDFDSQSVTGRTKAAQIPAAPSSAPEALAAAQAAENMAAAIQPRAPGPGPQSASTAVPAGASSASGGPTSSAPPPLSAPLAAPSVPIPAPFGPRAGSPPPIVTHGDEEQTLLTILRLMDRTGGLRSLSTVERALIAGAKSAFEHLSEECDRLLKRRLSDLERVPAVVSAPPALPRVGKGGTTRRGREADKPNAPGTTPKPKASARKSAKVETPVKTKPSTGESKPPPVA